MLKITLIVYLYQKFGGKYSHSLTIQIINDAKNFKETKINNFHVMFHLPLEIYETTFDINNS